MNLDDSNSNLNVWNTRERLNKKKLKMTNVNCKMTIGIELDFTETTKKIFLSLIKMHLKTITAVYKACASISGHIKSTFIALKEGWQRLRKYCYFI